MRPFLLFLLFSFLMPSCSPATPQVTPRLVNVYVTSAAYPRVADLYACAPSSLVVGLSDANSAEITMRLGEPSPLMMPAFKIGTEDILVVNHPEVGVGPLTLEQVQSLFSGQISNWKDVGGNDLPVQVWSFSRDEDVQQVFDQAVMNGQPVTTLARLAVSSQAMSDSVGTMPGSIGFLPRRWKAGNTREALKVATVPVLIIAPTEPQGAVKDLIGCLQAGK
jgi:phosphate transport system substrate-binding protein